MSFLSLLEPNRRCLALQSALRVESRYLLGIPGTPEAVSKRGFCVQNHLNRKNLNRTYVCCPSRKKKSFGSKKRANRSVDRNVKIPKISILCGGKYRKLFIALLPRIIPVPVRVVVFLENLSESGWKLCKLQLWNFSFFPQVLSDESNRSGEVFREFWLCNQSQKR